MAAATKNATIKYIIILLEIHQKPFKADIWEQCIRASDAEI